MRYLYAVHLPIICTIAFLLIKAWPVAGIYAFDLFKRSRDYVRLRRARMDNRIFCLYQGSYCQQSVVEAVWPEARAHYRKQGYRVYMILPDAWVKNPLSVLSISWWREFFRL